MPHRSITELTKLPFDLGDLLFCFVTTKVNFTICASLTAERSPAVTALYRPQKKIVSRQPQRSGVAYFNIVLGKGWKSMVVASKAA